MSKFDPQASIISNASVSSASSVLSLDHPMVVEKGELVEKLAIVNKQQTILNAEAKTLIDAINEIEKAINSPTTSSPYARQCVYVREGRAGKYRQLHITENDQLYYFSKSFRKTKIDPDR